MEEDKGGRIVLGSKGGTWHSNSSQELSRRVIRGVRLTNGRDEGLMYNFLRTLEVMIF